MHRTAIFCPTIQEAEALRLYAQHIQADIITTGIGKIKTVIACMEHLDNYDKFILAGFAGGYTGLVRGDVVYPSNIYEHDFSCMGIDGKEPKKLSIPFNKKADKKGFLFADFYSGDKLITSKTLPKLSECTHIACDMESYAFAYTMQLFGKEFAITKVVSDQCDEAAPVDFNESCMEFSGELFDSVMEVL